MSKILLSSERLVSTYKENQRKISELEKSQDQFHEQIKKRYNKIYCEYDDKITALEKKRDKLYHSLEKEEEKANNKTEKKIDYLYSPISHVKRTIYFLNQKQLKLNFDHTKTTNRHGYLELVEQHTTDHLKLGCYIAENSRPKNKYSLVVVGLCRFGKHAEHILKLPYDYEVLLSNDEIQWWDIEQAIKHFSSIELAKKYHQTHKIGQALNSFLVEYHKVLDQYQEAVNNYSISDFADILKGDDD